MSGPEQNKDRAWGEYWADQARRGGKGTGCLPEAMHSIARAQQQCWSGFADALPHNADVLDLATGNGILLHWLKAMRPDLSLTGIDLAPQLPPPPAGCRTLPGTRMENIPLGDASFDAIVSQFGFEYSDVAATIGEISRLLRDGGTVGLLLHRGDGPILEHNMARREAIRWVLEEQSLFEALRRRMNEGDEGRARAIEHAESVARQGAHIFGQQSPAWEISEAARQTLALGAKDSAEGIARTFDIIAQRAGEEMDRLGDLEDACATADDRAALLTLFADAGFDAGETRAISAGAEERPFADFLPFRKTR